MGFVLLLWLAAAALAEEPGPVIADRVVLVVEDTPILSSDLEFEAVLTGLDQSPSPFWSADFGTSASRLTDSEVLRRFARGVGLYEPSEAEIIERIAAMREKFGSDALWSSFLASWGMTDETPLVALLRRRMVAEKVLARSVEAPVNDERAWRDEAEALLVELRQRYRIRAVREHEVP